MKGILLETLTWLEAEKVLTPEAIVVFAIGAASKEHGPHLQLNNDFLMAEYLKNQVLEQANVVVAPTLNTHFYPAFVDYPGSICLRMDTARDLVVDVCTSLARFGPRRFYALNTGISTLRPLALSRDLLAEKGILLHYTDLTVLTADIEAQISEQEGGTHADEIETSMMLCIAPETVDMSKAVRDYHPHNGRFTRQPGTEGTYSATGIWGDPTLATEEKGRQVLDALIKGILGDLARLAAAPLESHSAS